MQEGANRFMPRWVWSNPIPSIKGRPTLHARDFAPLRFAKRVMLVVMALPRSRGSGPGGGARPARAFGESGLGLGCGIAEWGARWRKAPARGVAGRGAETLMSALAPWQRKARLTLWDQQAEAGLVPVVEVPGSRSVGLGRKGRPLRQDARLAKTWSRPGGCAWSARAGGGLVGRRA